MTCAADPPFRGYASVSTDDSQRLISGWVYEAMQPEVANAAAAAVSAPLDQVPRQHGPVKLTHVAHAFLAYWWHVRGDKIMPDATDIVIPQLRTLAPYVRYMHWDGDKLIHRLWGSALTEGIGLDLTGHDALAYIPEDRRDANRNLFRSLHTHQCGLVVLVRNDSRSEGLMAELTFLPVATGPGKPQRLIGTMQWRRAEGASVVLPIESGKPQELSLEAILFLDLGAGLPDQDLLAGL